MTAATRSGDTPTARTDYTTLDDNELLSLIGENHDRFALAELYERYRLSVGHFLRRKMCEPRLVDEVYNDVMLTVWKNATRFRGDSKVSTWIFGIAYRTRLTHNRKESRHNHCGTEEFMINVESEDADDMENQAAISEAIHSALTSLSEQHRSVIELAYFHGYSTQEIADIVGCPQNTVKTRLFHARKNLRATLEADQTTVATRSDNDRYSTTERQSSGYFLQAAFS